jgi:hypothetical protein
MDRVGSKWTVQGPNGPCRVQMGRVGSEWTWFRMQGAHRLLLCCVWRRDHSSCAEARDEITAPRQGERSSGDKQSTRTDVSSSGAIRVGGPATGKRCSGSFGGGAFAKSSATPARSSAASWGHRRLRAIITSAEAQRREQGFARTTRAKAKRSVQPSRLSSSATVLKSSRRRRQDQSSPPSEFYRYSPISAVRCSTLPHAAPAWRRPPGGSVVCASNRVVRRQVPRAAHALTPS